MNEFDSAFGFDDDPFADFIEGLDLPDLPVDTPIPASRDEIPDTAAEVSDQLRKQIHRSMMKYVNLGSDDWIDHMQPLQALILHVLLTNITLDPDKLGDMSREELADRTAFTFLGLGLLVFGDMLELDDESDTPVF